MKWIVGVDLRHRSDGAIKLARWLSERSAERERCELVGVHVVEASQMAALQRFDPRPAVLSRLAEEAALVVQNAGAGEILTKIDVIEGRGAAHSLESACIYHHGDGLIIGRKAGAQEHTLVRLGSVARHILHALPAPVFVVAPDLDESALGEGPIIVATVPTDASLSACNFARALGERIGREVVFVRVVTVPEDYAHIYWSGEALEAFRAEFLDRAREQLRDWLAANGFGDARYEVRYGPEVGELVAAANLHASPLIVTGSRLLGTFERMLTPSTSSELAAHAPCPVVVVPPDHRGKLAT
ncbi:MAG: universal stress protein [Myxococcales bacterium]|nr:universal stress protein [Myxococcales bacterium]